jgi:DNA-binding NarL/FixJ family response regulator
MLRWLYPGSAEVGPSESWPSAECGHEDSNMTHETRGLQILLLEDHALVRAHLTALLEQEPDLVVRSMPEDGATAASLLRGGEPDLVILDVASNRSRGLGLLKELKALCPKLPVLVLSMHDETLYAERAFQAGAAGFITKEESAAKIVPAVRKVLGGENYLGERLAERLRQKQSGKAGAEVGSPLEMLTEREWEIFQKIGSGMDANQVAAELRLGVKTIESYRARISEKLQLPDGVELADHARQWLQRPVEASAQA